MSFHFPTWIFPEPSKVLLSRKPRVIPCPSMVFHEILWDPLTSPTFPLLLSTFPHIYLLFPTHTLFFPIISYIFPMFPWYYSHRTLCFLLEIMLKLLNSISVCDNALYDNHIDGLCLRCSITPPQLCCDLCHPADFEGKFVVSIEKWKSQPHWSTMKPTWFSEKNANRVGKNIVTKCQYCW